MTQPPTTAPDAATTGIAPPYISFLTFQEVLNWISTLSDDAAPTADDLRSRFGTSLGGQVVAALRFLGLIDGPSDATALRDLATAAEESRSLLLAPIVREAYDLPFESLPGATMGDLRMWFDSAYHIEGHTQRKAISFFINAARSAGLPLSPQLAKSVRPRIGSNRPENHRPSTSAAQRVRPADGSSSRGGAPVPRRPEFRPPSAQGAYNVRTIKLASGGTVTVTLDLDLFALSAEDQKFVLEVVGLIKGYVRTPASQPDAGAPAALAR
jgi:hypothetical protein